MYTVLFDGVCNFCNASINFVIDHDRSGRFVFASLQSEKGQQLLKTYHQDYNRIDLRSIVLIKDGKVYEKSDAVLQIARDLDGLWPLLYAFRVIPRTIRDGIYNWIARNRYRWFGRQEACRLPSPELRQRFLV
jgi:predicted DCC family thiol-disulfide oxidoreductase YuxK